MQHRQHRGRRALDQHSAPAASRRKAGADEDRSPRSAPTSGGLEVLAVLRRERTHEKAAFGSRTSSERRDTRARLLFSSHAKRSNATELLHSRHAVLFSIELHGRRRHLVHGSDRGVSAAIARRLRVARRCALVTPPNAVAAWLHAWARPRLRAPRQTHRWLLCTPSRRGVTRAQSVPIRRSRNDLVMDPSRSTPSVVAVLDRAPVSSRNARSVRSASGRRHRNTARRR